MYKNSNLLPSYTVTDYMAFCGTKLIKTDTVYLLLKFTSMNTPLLQTSKQLNKNRNQYYLHNIYMATDYMAHNKA